MIWRSEDGDVYIGTSEDVELETLTYFHFVLGMHLAETIRGDDDE